MINQWARALKKLEPIIKITANYFSLQMNWKKRLSLIR